MGSSICSYMFETTVPNELKFHMKTPSERGCSHGPGHLSRWPPRPYI